MVFSNAVFLFLFLPIVLLVYYSPLCRKIQTKNVWLLFVSLGFYAWGEPIYVFLMLLSICMNYFLGRWASTCSRTGKGKRIVALACIYNLGMLFVFKYLAWFLKSIGVTGSGSSQFTLALPIGISFYTFQALSYVIDVYRGQEEAQENILNVGLYIAFFPQLIAGPIVRYGTISRQLKERRHSFGLFSEGAWRFIIGLSKKLLLANQLAAVADVSFARDAAGRSVLLAWCGVLSFMLQIYFDFSGYSDMAIGLGKMFGFEFLENFRYPYVARSVTEYWRRWHISLGEWFRDYVFYPLSIGPAVRWRRRLSRHISRRTSGIICNTAVLLILWLATGIWHGANWTFVVWGLIQFVFIVWEQYRKPLKNERLGNILGLVGTFLVILLAKVVFKADSLSHAFRYYTSMFHLSGNAWIDNYSRYWVGQYKAFLILGFVFAFPVVEQAGRLLERKNKEEALRVWGYAQAIAMVALLFVDICFAIGSGYNPFIYFNF